MLMLQLIYDKSNYFILKVGLLLDYYVKKIIMYIIQVYYISFSLIYNDKFFYRILFTITIFYLFTNF